MKWYLDDSLLAFIIFQKRKKIGNLVQGIDVITAENIDDNFGESSMTISCIEGCKSALRCYYKEKWEK